ncbi:MAG TPA: phage tail tip lysozyme [Kofleriaceae bacterium]|jgi:hypothetical protein
MRGLPLALLALASCTTEVDDTLPPPAPPPLSEAALSSPELSAYNYFVAKGLTADQSAGIVGNLMQESNVIATAVEYDGGPGRGIAQWSVGGRWDTSSKDNVVWYANANGGDEWSLDTQLDFVWYELTSIGYGYSTLEASTTVSAATIAFEDKYEICGNCEQTQRIDYAEEVLADAGSSGGGGGGGGGSGNGPAGCYSDTLGQQMPANACVQSRFDDDWYQCDNGSWVDRWSDPDACDGVYPL